VSLLVRDAVPADAPFACMLVRRSITELCVADHGNDARTIGDWLANKTNDNFAAWISSAQRVTLVAERADSMAGFAMLDLDRNGTISLLYIAPEERFSGVSSALLEAVEARASASGLAELRLNSTATALQFYEKRGYVTDGDPVPGFGITAKYQLRKVLGTGR
jgi:GNAT superfamily N-acetyltransferase